MDADLPARDTIPTSADVEATVTLANGSRVTIRELHERCVILDAGVILMRELPFSTVETFDIMLDRCYELGASFDRFTMVVDLSENTVRPKGRHLEHIWRAFGRGAVHHAFVPPGTAFLKIVLQFVLNRIQRNVSVHPSRAEALAHCRRALQPGP
jgi:hypothetical protein